MGQGRIAESGALANRGLALLDAAGLDAPATRILLLLNQGRTVRVTGRVTGTGTDHYQLAIRALSLAEELGDPELIIWALNALGIVLTDAGAPTAYLAVLDRATKLAREHRLLLELGRSLTNTVSVIYLEDLDAATTLVSEGIEVARQVGDNTQTEVFLINACFTWFLRGEWDRLATAVHEQVDGREPSVNAGTLMLMLMHVHQARGEALPEARLVESEDPYDQLVFATARALMQAEDGDLEAAASYAAEVTQAMVAGAGMREDLEMLWGPVVELQLAAGRLDAAAELLDLAGPSLGGRSTALRRGVVPRLRGLLALARGEDPEADLRQAELALDEYAAPYLLARTRVALARWMQDQGRGTEAAALLAQARPVFV